MPSAGTSRDSTRFVSLFQKAHGYIAALQRVDEQIAALFEQRRKAIDDLRAVQGQINNEFQRMLELDRVIPADTLSQASEDQTFDGAKPPVEPRLPPELRVAPRDAKPSPAAAPAPAPRLAVLEPAGS